jgi:DNA-directed RNA polymerase specialized sigma24 family protein
MEPTVSAVAATRRGCQDVDERRNIVVRIMGELRANGFHRLKLYVASAERRAQGSFEAWLVTLASRSTIRYNRTHARSLPRSRSTLETSELRVDSLQTVKGVEARKVLAKARELLTESQFAALLLWLAGWDHGEIADRLQLGGAVSANRLVRSGLWRLRDRLGIRDGADRCDASGKKIDTDA